jgi:hypothetical protein
VFTARYALSPYIKQIRFVFKGLRPVLLYFKRNSPVLERQSESNASWKQVDMLPSPFIWLHIPVLIPYGIGYYFTQSLSFTLFLAIARDQDLHFNLPSSTATLEPKSKLQRLNTVWLNIHHHHCARFEVLTALTVRISVFCQGMSCSLVET